MANTDAFIKQVNDGIVLSVRVQPGAHRSAIVGLWNKEFLKIALQAPAVDGKANEALIVFLSDLLTIKKSSIFIVTGKTSRCKLVRIETNLENIEEKLSKWIQQK